MSCQLNDSISKMLLDWFTVHQRALPWRENRTPYRVWVSEVMLQQTQVITVIPYFNAFLARFPTLDTLASAGQDEVLKIWEGLGYYARARNMHEAAQRIVEHHAGQLPDDFNALVALPGIGEYIAGAILSLAYGRDIPALDANGYRVLARLCAIRQPIDKSAVRNGLRVVASAILPAGRAGPFNEALIELGALCCTPKNPTCDQCPLNDDCQSRIHRLQNEIPIRRPRRATPHFDVTAGVIWREGKVLISQRPENKMLGGMWEFPGGKREEDESLPVCLRREIREELGIDIEVGEPMTRFDHAYSHMRITLHVFHCRPLNGPPRAIEVADWRWADVEELDKFPLSATDQRVARLLQRKADENYATEE